jgi:hypothetical protein
MSTIHQIRVVFDPPEDRLLMSIISKDGLEYRMWLTRRFVTLMWPNLVKLAEATPEAAAQQSEEARQSVVRFQHEQAVRSAQFSSTYDSEKVVRQSLGDSPVLITQGSIKRSDDVKEPNRIAFMSKDGKPITLAVDTLLLHSLLRLVRNAVKKADWDLDLGPLSGEGITAQDGDTAQRVIN